MNRSCTALRTAARRTAQARPCAAYPHSPAGTRPAGASRTCARPRRSTDVAAPPALPHPRRAAAGRELPRHGPREQHLHRARQEHRVCAVSQPRGRARRAACRPAPWHAAGCWRGGRAAWHEPLCACPAQLRLAQQRRVRQGGAAQAVAAGVHAGRGADGALGQRGPQPRGHAGAEASRRGEGEGEAEAEGRPASWEALRCLRAAAGWRWGWQRGRLEM